LLLPQFVASRELASKQQSNTMFAMIRRMKDGAGTGEFLSGLSERII
jgi:hypothetical protein